MNASLKSVPESFDFGDSMNRVQLTREEDGSFLLEIIIYSSSPHRDDSSGYVKVSAEQAKELSRWLAT